MPDLATASTRQTAPVRDTSRDGARNRLEDFLLLGFKPFWGFINRRPRLARFVNKAVVNIIVLKAPARPLALTTMASYTSWPSLTDRTWFSRYLPRREPHDLPGLDEVSRLFDVKPSGPVSSTRSTLLFPSFAQWFTDGFLMTNDDDRRRTRTNHQVDLSQLYGLRVETTEALRLLSEAPGRKGRLKSEISDRGDEWAPALFGIDGRKKAEFANVPDPVNMPAEMSAERRSSLFAFGGERTNSTAYTTAINTLFLREHNRLCGVIEAAHPEWDDEQVFQTVRNVSIVQLIKVVIEEYINHISPYWLRLLCNPTFAYDAVWYRDGWIPLEFNILYRLHSLVPEAAVWNGERLAVYDLIFDNRRLLADGLGAGFDSATRTDAGRVGLFNTSRPLLAVERATVNQSRENGISSYNDYREVMNYPRVTAFEQISSDPQTIGMLKSLYGHVDRIEFYPGLLAEDTAARAAVPPLLGRMVAVDAFSHLLTNPLLSANVYNDATFSPEGMASIEATSTLRDLVDRNVAGAERFQVSMEQDGRNLAA